MSAVTETAVILLGVNSLAGWYATGKFPRPGHRRAQSSAPQSPAAQRPAVLAAGVPPVPPVGAPGPVAEEAAGPGSHPPVPRLDAAPLRPGQAGGRARAAKAQRFSGQFARPDGANRAADAMNGVPS